MIKTIKFFIDDVPVDVLKKVLLNHVIVDIIQYRDFETGYFKTAAQYINGNSMRNLSIHIEQVNMRVTLNGESMVTQEMYMLLMVLFMQLVE